MHTPSRVFLVDDDPHVLRALERLLRANGFAVEAFTSPDAFLQRQPYEGAACAVLDLRMPTLSGLDVQHVLARSGSPMPIVFLSALTDVPSTVRAMREGAIDFLVKPVDERQLLDAIGRALQRAAEQENERRVAREMQDRLARLTKREREVCELVGRGLLNKQIAHELGTSEKTVKVHRSRVMHKLKVSSVAALVRLLTHQAPDKLDQR